MKRFARELVIAAAFACALVLIPLVVVHANPLAGLAMILGALLEVAR